MKMIFCILGILVMLYTVYAAWHFYSRYRISKTLVAEAVPYTQEGTGQTILVVGDSTAVGVGAHSSKDSLAGRIGGDMPNAAIEVVARSGATLSDGMDFLSAAKETQYHAILIQLGANDIVGRTSLSDAKEVLAAILREAKKKSDHVYVLHSGNVGAAGIFPFPVDRLYERRTRVFRDMYRAEAYDAGATYIDLFSERSDDLFLKEPMRYLAHDMFHPSSDGYALWYQTLRSALIADGIVRQ